MSDRRFFLKVTLWTVPHLIDPDKDLSFFLSPDPIDPEPKSQDLSLGGTQVEGVGVVREPEGKASTKDRDGHTCKSTSGRGRKERSSLPPRPRTSDPYVDVRNGPLSLVHLG